eukprot:1186912-Prorocentrum_minimum.AAC.3
MNREGGPHLWASTVVLFELHESAEPGSEFASFCLFSEDPLRECQARCHVNEFGTPCRGFAFTADPQSQYDGCGDSGGTGIGRCVLYFHAEVPITGTKTSSNQEYTCVVPSPTCSYYGEAPPDVNPCACSPVGNWNGIGGGYRGCNDAFGDPFCYVSMQCE